MKESLLTALLGLISVLLSACATVETVRNAPESRGREHVYDLPYNSMVDLIAEILPSIGLAEIERESSEQGVTVFLGTHGVTWSSWGEIVRVVVNEVDIDTTNVTVYWRSRFRDGLNPSAPNWYAEVPKAIEMRSGVSPAVAQSDSS